MNIPSTWLDLADANRGSPRFDLSYAVFQAVLDGVALTFDELAAKTTIERSEALHLIEEMVNEGRLRLNDRGDRVIAAGGLSLADSRHTLNMHGRRFGVWCALDAVGIPAGLGADALVESESVDTGEPVRVEIEHGQIRHQSPPNLRITLAPASVATSVFDTL